MTDHKSDSPTAPECISLRALLAKTFPPQEYLIEPWLRQAESCMIWAAVGVGKTLLAMTVALAIAGGGKFIGWTAPKPRRVLWIDGEMHAADLQDRFKRLTKTVEGIDATAAAGNLDILARQLHNPETPFPSLSDNGDDPESGQRVYLKIILDGRYDLVVLDNFSTLATVADENAASEMRPALDFLLRLKQANVACILVHHSKKSGDSFRGSTNLATTFEAIMGLQRDKTETGYEAAFNIDFTKFRQKRDDRTRGRSVRLTEEPGKGNVWTFELSLQEQCSDLVERVRSGLYSSDGAAGLSIGYDKSKTSRLKAQAFGLGLTTRAEWGAWITAARDAGMTAPHSDF